MLTKSPTASNFRLLPVSDRIELIDSMNEREAKTLYYDWRFWARPEQVEPKGLGAIGRFIWFSKSGRGAGKTRQFAEWVIEKVRDHGYRYISLVGAASDEVRTIMIEGESGILNCSPPWFMPDYEPSKKRVTWPNGAVAQIYYGSEPDKARGAQSDLVWCDELAKWKYPEDTFDNVLLGLRLGKNPLCGVSTTPRPTKFIKELVRRPEVIVTEGKTMDNIDNLAPPFIQTVIRKYVGTRLGLQELDGRLLDDNQNALWKRQWIDATRIKYNDLPQLWRVVVPIDPAVTSTETSDEIGIVPTGEGPPPAIHGVRFPDMPHYYILDDFSLKGTPLEWGSKAITAYHHWKADRIIGETNNGGDLIESNLKNIDRNIPYAGVHASRGKVTRAEPISALYEQGRVHHVGTFGDLEDEQCEWEPGMPSPSRLDSVVWGISWLMKKEIVDAPKTKRTAKTRSKVRNLPT